MSQLDLIRSHPWRRVAFTTYALSLAFFEAVILDALVRGNGRNALILADIEGVRASLGEQGARGAGRDYEIEPVAAAAGIFHPKLTVLTGADDCHLMVGSGNLTFGGWGGNFEVVEHLHPDFAATAFGDASDFFELLAASHVARHGAADQCHDIADDLRKSVRGRSDRGDIRILHSIRGGIARQIADLAGELGGATSLLVASPYWDNGQAISDLAALLELDRVQAHVHPGGAARGTAASWPLGATTTIEPVCLDFANKDARPLHGKLFEVLCKRGRLLVSGSANATTSALSAGMNIEASVVRIQRERLSGWTFAKADPPEFLEPLKEDETDEAVRRGVLRAVLEGDRISGQVLAPQITGIATALQITSRGPEVLGELHLDDAGTFSIDAPGLELAAWNSGRLVLRIEAADGRIAEGFISIAAAGIISRRAGAMVPRLLSLLAGTETPADVAAIMDWIHEAPGRLSDASGFGEGAGNPAPSKVFSDAVFDVSAFGARDFKVSGSEGASGAVVGRGGWCRFIDQLLASLSRSRPAFDAADDDTEGDEADDGAKTVQRTRSGDMQREIARAQASIEALIGKLLERDNAQRHGLNAFDLTAYMRQRLDLTSGQSLAWLDTIAGRLPPGSVPAERMDDVAAALLLLVRSPDDRSGARRVRATLMRLGRTIGSEPPVSEMTSLFAPELPSRDEMTARWEAVVGMRTPEEHVAGYLAALSDGDQDFDGAALRELAPDEWPLLQKALTSPRHRGNILTGTRNATSCPQHGSMLPVYEQQKYRTTLIGVTRNCCHKILVFGGDR